jgi:hypothetical protein
VNVVAIRAEMAEALAGIGITTYDHTPDTAELPAAFIGFPDSVAYNSTASNRNFRGGYELDIPVLVIVDDMESRFAQMRLAAAISTVDTTDTIEGLTESGSADGIVIQPVKNALEAHSTDAWHELVVGEATDFGSYEIAGVTGLGVVFPATVRVNRPPS